MLLHLAGIIAPDQLPIISAALDSARFIDGKLSAGSAARAVKHNEELDQQDEIARHLSKIVIGSLYHNPLFRSAALPQRISTPYFARYTQGMGYGDHIDDPVMGASGERYRADIAVTVFLSAPETYQGGELIINASFGTQAVKLAAGDAVIYPASSRHRVAPVTQGTRLVAVAWIQSLVRDPARRELLHELNAAREALLRAAPGDITTAQVDHSYVNLVRMWSEV